MGQTNRNSKNGCATRLNYKKVKYPQTLLLKVHYETSVPTVRDRVVQAALRAVLEPIFERDFAAHSYGFRPNRGCKDALRRVDALLQAGYNWVVDADLKSHFGTIPQAALMERVREEVADGRALGLLEAFLTQKVMETAEGWTPEEGTPQRAVISPLLSNIYLDPLDHRMEARGAGMVRYADDFVILCRSEAEARPTLERVQGWTAETGLRLHPDKTRIVDATQRGGFDFLGYHFERGCPPCDRRLHLGYRSSIGGEGIPQPLL